MVNTRTRLLSGVARAAFTLRAEVVERGFALILDRGGMRRAWLRGRENLHKRYLIHVAGHNLGLIMRLLIGVYRTRMSGQWVALCGAPEGLLLPDAAHVGWAAMAVLLDQPFGVVAGDEGPDGVAHLLDGLEDAAMDDLFFQGAE